ncbi:Hsd3b6 [Cordylochernes scorpioides]|uniref:Hsd3b6 n=1 Tax=Cordylochernes scorpioides TaxID=51811 RepID=A0ABY6KVQ0_9ARAC|nr:Hsd3b6 [Cordylochernes scorpioides]
MAKEVVLVTGSSGCLGQHIVKLLQEKSDNVKEIRLYDIKAYSNELGHSDKKPMKEYVADILDMDKLEEAMEGVDCVIHTAAYIDVSLHPDDAKMESVNVRACYMDAMCDVYSFHIRLGCMYELRPTCTLCVKARRMSWPPASRSPCPAWCTPVPWTWSLPGSTSSTAWRTRRLCLAAGCSVRPPAPSTAPRSPYSRLADVPSPMIWVSKSLWFAVLGEDKLRTASIRPTVFYGEGDKYFVTKMFEWARKHNGKFQRVHSLDERLQITYVGNVAWAHLNAKDKLAVDDSVSGEAFYITDETPIQDVYINTKPYFEAAEGVHLSRNVLPYWIVWILLIITSFLMKFFRPLCSNLTIPPLPVVDYLCSTFFFNRTKAILRLDYAPIYTPEEAQERSLAYYKKM